MASDLVKSLVATGVRDGLNRRSSVGGSFVEPPLLPPEGPVAFGARGGASGNTNHNNVTNNIILINNGNNRFTPKGAELGALYQLII